MTTDKSNFDKIYRLTGRQLYQMQQAMWVTIAALRDVQSDPCQNETLDLEGWADKIEGHLFPENEKVLDDDT